MDGEAESLACLFSEQALVLKNQVTKGRAAFPRGNRVHFDDGGYVHVRNNGGSVEFKMGIPNVALAKAVIKGLEEHFEDGVYMCSEGNIPYVSPVSSQSHNDDIKTLLTKDV